MEEAQVFALRGSADDANVKTSYKDILRVFAYSKNKFLMVISLITAIAAGVVMVLMNIILGDLMTTMSFSDFMGSVKKIILKFVYVVVGITVLQVASYGIRSFNIPLFERDLRDALYGHLLKMDIKFFDKNPTGVLVSRMSADVTMMVQTYSWKLFDAFQFGAQVIAAVVIAVVYNWRACLAAAAFIPLMIITILVAAHYVDKLWKKFSDNTTRSANKAEEVITSFRTVKSFDRELHESVVYAESLGNVYSVFAKTSLVNGIKEALVSCFTWGAMAVVLYYSSHIFYHEKKGQSGDIITTLSSLVIASMGASQIFVIRDDLKKAGVSSAKYLALMDTEAEVDNRTGDTLDVVKGRVEFKNVGFKYESSDEYAVKNLSFTIEAGETVALVGESGCGKTTTLQLLQRFYDVQEGEILLDGVDIKTLAPNFLRKQIAAVPQTPVLFSMTIKDNIRFGNLEATDEEIAEAATVGNAHNFIMELQDNYDTVVQQISLSGGQKQRVCISRAILANATILLLDEATAALDTESERLVQQSLETFRQGKTALIVAHRLATVINADRILVFREGTIVESGTHEELLQSSGIYSDLVRYQLQ